MTDLRKKITARVPKGVRDAIGDSTVGIAGCGGLGSNIAAYLVRSGIGKVVIADFDTVEYSNLNRQNYFLDDIGCKKVDATRRHLERMNPSTKVETHDAFLTPENIPTIFDGCDIVCEAFDSAEAKAMIISTMAERMPGVPLVCGNGMGGISDPSDMKTRRLTDNLYVCGDGTSGFEIGLAAPRVAICAGLMANKVLQLLTQK